MKIAIAVDRLVNYGGVERIISLLADRFDVDIYVGWYTPETTFQNLREKRITQLIPPGSVLNKPYMYRLRGRVVQHRFKSLRIPEHDAYITFGGKSLSIARNHHPCVWHCQAPTRWLYDLYLEELKKYSFPKKQLFQLSCHFLRKADQENVKSVDKIVAIAGNVRERVRRTYGRDSVIAYPPVDISRFRYRRTGDFYLSSARLTPDKRVDVIVSAFQEMPEARLIVAGGGSDLEKIRKMAVGHPNIEVLGWVSEQKLMELYSDCIATIAASLHEDFGLVATESMAAGKPAIAPGDKGFAETVVDKKTGLLIDPSKENIIAAVKYLTPEKAKEMRSDCERRAQDFSEEKYLSGLRKAIEDAISEYKKRKDHA